MEHSIRVQGPQTKVVRLRGELDASQALPLRDLLAAELADSSVVVDLKEVPFIDSSVIGVLVAAHRAADSGGVSLIIANPCEAVNKVLALTRTDRVLRVFDDVQAAAAAASAA